MALKKPSEYFKKEITSVNQTVQEMVKVPELNTFSDAFESFKNNLNKIEVLSEFSETLDNYRVNIERVNFLSEKVEDIQTEIETLLKREDLDRAMLSQLLVFEQSICDVQTKVRGINEKNLTEIRLDVTRLTESVSQFLEVEVPKYKKLVIDSEIRSNDRYDQLETNVNLTLEGIGQFVDKRYEELQETLQGINEDSLSGIIEDFKTLDESVIKLKEEEIPKYKGFIVETERKTEIKLESFNQKLDKTVTDVLETIDEKLDERVNGIQDSIEKIDKKFSQIQEEEIPKYKGFIVESKLKTESTLKEFTQKLDKTLETLDEKLDETVTDVLEKINAVEVINSSVEKRVSQKIEEVQNLQIIVNNELKNVEENKEELSKKVINLESEIVRNESHIRSQNKYIENIQEEVREVISRLQIESLEEKNYELSKKVKYLEEIFEKFSEKEILTENIIVEPPEVKNDDPLTPLDQNFVTLDQLNQHYRLFLNRIQQQLATIGGGGETRLKYLDDIVGIATNASAYDGKFLKYNHAIKKFEFVTVSTGGGGGGESYWVQSGVGIVTTTNVGVKTDNPTSALTVNGDALIVGIVTATDFNSASDIKLKENISVIDNPIDKVVKLEGVNFFWKDNGKKSLGVIAQEVEKVLPELVSGEESKTVNYNGIIGLLIECVKQQQKEIEDLKKYIHK